MPQLPPPKARTFWPVLLLLFLADCSSKRWAEEALAGTSDSREFVGDVLRLTLTYNPGAAFSTSLGEYSRVIFSGAAIAMTFLLYRYYRASRASDVWMGSALGLIVGGALGNLLDRVLSDRGVVDFIDMGLGGTRLWICNVADVGVTVGAILFLALTWRRQTEPNNDRTRAR